jgi:hypothetical protein
MTQNSKGSNSRLTYSSIHGHEKLEPLREIEPNTRRPLSPHQDRLLRSLCRFVHVFHRQPSYRELADLMGSANIQRTIAEIEAKGWIRRSGGKRGAIEIPDDVYEDVIIGPDENE